MGETVVGAVVLFAPVLVMALFLWGALAPGETTFELTESSLIARLHRGDVIVALRRQLVMPRAAIRGVAVAATASIPPDNYRIMGTGFPGLKAGLFGGGGSWRQFKRRDFWVVRRAREVMVVEMNEGWKINRYVFELADPRSEALRLRAEVGAFAGTYTAEI